MPSVTFGKKLLKNEVVRFILSAGMGFLVDISLFYVLDKYLPKKIFLVFSFKVPIYDLILFVSFFIGVVVNFLMTRYFVFTQSATSPSKQFFRFISVAILGYFANLGVLTIFVNVLKMSHPEARITAALSLFFASFFVHKLFSFSLSLRHHSPGKHPKH
jgi:putative flippase GtrA